MINKLEGITIDNKYYKFTEEEPSLLNGVTYYIEETYKFFYSIENRSSHELTIKMETASSEIELLDNKIKKNTAQQCSIILKPTSEGKKSFQLFAELPRVKKEILKKIFNVELKSIEIEAKIDKPLPNSMKLGQKAETIFLFANKGNQTVTGVSIDIKQIEVTQ